jgi:putative oxidoreductase
MIGFGFIVHGYAKLSRGPDTFAVILHTLGVPMPFLLAWVATLVELTGGFAGLIGAFVWIAAVPLTVVLFTALFTIHLPYGFFTVKLVEVTASGTTFGPAGYEILLLYLASLISLVLAGAGPMSLDEWRSSRSKRALVDKSVDVTQTIRSSKASSSPRRSTWRVLRSATAHA